MTPVKKGLLTPPRSPGSTATPRSPASTAIPSSPATATLYSGGSLYSPGSTPVGRIRRAYTPGARSNLSQSYLSVCSSAPSFLNPTGPSAKEPPPHTIGPVLEILFFFFFSLVRAVHPVIIESSKTIDEESGKKVFAYQTYSTTTSSAICIAVLMLFVSAAVGGKAELASIFRVRPLMLFSAIGLVTALADTMEMAIFAMLHGSCYQILMQSRIVLTAIILVFIKGVNQTRLQWILLTMLMFSLCTYMVVLSAGDQAKGQSGGIPVFGILVAFIKMTQDCTASVCADKYMKVYKDEPTHVKIARIFLAKSVGLILLIAMSGTSLADLFTGWDSYTPLVASSFLVRGVACYYCLAILDSILMYIADCFAILLVYAHDMLAPWAKSSFNISVFLAILMVIGTCAAYIDSKAPIEKAANYDKMKAEKICRQSTLETVPDDTEIGG